MSKKPLITLALSLTLGSTNLFAWDREVYETVRETIVTKLGNTMSSSKKNGRLRHFDWNQQNNKFAEQIANRIASDQNPEQRARIFWNLTLELQKKITANERSSYNPHLNNKVLIALADKASVNEDLAEAFLVNLRHVRSDDTGPSAQKKAHMEQAYQLALEQTSDQFKLKDLAVIETAPQNASASIENSGHGQ
jgi:hypothetical protein